MKNTIFIFYVIFREISENWTPKQIKKFRKALERTQTKFGEMVGVGKITVFQWERGERTPSKTAKILLSRIEEELKNGKD